MRALPVSPSNTVRVLYLPVSGSLWQRERFPGCGGGLHGGFEADLIQQCRDRPAQRFRDMLGVSRVQQLFGELARVALNAPQLGTAGPIRAGSRPAPCDFS